MSESVTEEKLVDQHAAEATAEKDPEWIENKETPKIAAAKEAIKKTIAKPVESEKQPEPPKVEELKEEKPETEIQTVHLEPVKPAEIKDGQIQFTPKHLQLIRTQIAKDANDSEYELFLMMAYRTRLDPLLKQLQFVKYGSNVSYITSIDGYRIIAHRSGDFAGVDEPIYTRDPKGFATHAAITVYKFVQGVKCAFTAKVKMSEYNKGKNNWVSMPETMIAKVAEAHALRKAFPNDLSGIYTQEEMEQADNGKPNAPANSPNGSTTVAPQPPRAINQGQLVDIKKIMEEKALPVDKVKQLCVIAFKKESIQFLTFDEAYKLIVTLRQVPSQAPKVDDSLVTDAMDIFAPEPMDEVVNTDEVIAGMEGVSEN